jgi:Holliday junction resolvasome RuvABC endonuclease subunit
MFDSARERAASSHRPCFAGIAPGLQITVWALLGPSGDAPITFCVMTPGAVRGGVGRYSGFVRMVVAALRDLEGHGPPDLVAVRGYTMGLRSQAHLELIELGAVLRLHVLGRGWPVVEVPPGTLHKFAVGGGDPNRVMLVAALSSAYGRSFKRVQEAEAYALAQAARCLVRPQDYPPWRATALDRISRPRACSTDRPRSRGELHERQGKAG